MKKRIKKHLTVSQIICGVIREIGDYISTHVYDILIVLGIAFLIAIGVIVLDSLMDLTKAIFANLLEGRYE